MSLVAAGLIAGGAVIGAYGQLKAGKNARAYFRMQAEFLKQREKEIMLRNEMNNKLVWRETAMLLGEQKVAIAGSGIDVGSMSALEIANQTTKLAAEQVARQTREARYEAQMTGIEAQMSIFSGESQYRAAKWQALGTLLGGAGQMYAVGATPRSTGTETRGNRVDWGPPPSNSGATYRSKSYASSPRGLQA